jgi:hypothetical protein
MPRRRRRWTEARRKPQSVVTRRVSPSMIRSSACRRRDRWRARPTWDADEMSNSGEMLGTGYIGVEFAEAGLEGWEVSGWVGEDGRCADLARQGAGVGADASRAYTRMLVSTKHKAVMQLVSAGVVPGGVQGLGGPTEESGHAVLVRRFVQHLGLHHGTASLTIWA